MRGVFRIPVITCVAVFVVAAAASARDDSAVRNEIHHLHWLKGHQALGASHGAFSVPAGAGLVAGADAHKLDIDINGGTQSDSEAILRGSNGILYLSYDDAGYVSLDSWKDVDSAKMLDDMKKATDDGNEARRQAGVSVFHVSSWQQQPTLDRKHNTVRWVVNLVSDDGKPFVNAVALALGRHGYERFTYATRAGHSAETSRELSALVSDYTFDRGSRFGEFVQGDKVADFGIAALVGTAAGVTIAKTVGFGALLLLVKKFFILIIAFGAGIFGWIRRSLGMAKRAAPVTMPVSSPYVTETPPASTVVVPPETPHEV